MSPKPILTGCVNLVNPLHPSSPRQRTELRVLGSLCHGLSGDTHLKGCVDTEVPQMLSGIRPLDSTR